MNESGGGAASAPAKVQKAIGGVRRSFTPWTDPSAVPLIRFEYVTKRFGDFTAVDNVSLDMLPSASSSPCSAPRAAARPR